MTRDDRLRARLRALPSFAGSAEPFDPATAPPTPGGLFVDWLLEAVDSGAPSPQGAVLSTVGSDGVVSARTLIVKDVVDDAWLFATESTSPKARELSANPSAALTFFWPTRGRQVKVAGSVRRLPDAEGAADFRARPPQSRATSLVGHQSEPLGSIEELQAAYDAALARAESDPGLVEPAWSVYALDARSVEFWQTAPGRSATRLVYRRDGDGWSSGLLWP
ncbi:pyridoxine/pyridoxamine 5'-phosphate oxidase [Cellulomonas alba]|uniref:Pyridoxal 5'-phosphate synthase n=1 Tax=Cellulomonas alba TaxID=3053467 RepID=A0ABT7SJ46_9CELL|nr:pyridoxal 5'-phosphate synthase [Cellulomonas alba]MDM7856206.1 pyridoxal 5'-phosphate synthase [Cellulomonas alba]